MLRASPADPTLPFPGAAKDTSSDVVIAVRKSGALAGWAEGNPCSARRFGLGGLAEMGRDVETGRVQAE